MLLFTDLDVNFIKDMKISEKERGEEGRASTLLSEENDYANQASEAISFEKQPKVVNSIKIESQKQDKNSADEVLNKDYFTIQKFE